MSQAPSSRWALNSFQRGKTFRHTVTGKGKQQVQRLKSAVVNLPQFLSRFSFRDTNEFATETKQSLSHVSLCVFKIARWLKRACNILDRSHVLILLAVEKDLSPVALVAGLTWFNLQIEQQWRWRSTVARLAADLGLPSKFPESSVKGLLAWALEMYLIEQQGRWYWHRRWTSMPNRLPLFLNVYFLLEIGGAKAPPNPPGSAVPVVAVVGKREVKIATTK